MKLMDLIHMYAIVLYAFNELQLSLSVNYHFNVGKRPSKIKYSSIKEVNCHLISQAFYCANFSVQ